MSDELHALLGVYVVLNITYRIQVYGTLGYSTLHHAYFLDNPGAWVYFEASEVREIVSNPCVSGVDIFLNIAK